MSTILSGGLVRAIQALAAAAPTLIVGLFIAAIFRYYLGIRGTYKLFGSNTVRALPQSWAIGMLLPVCSLGVLPILRELKRAGVRPGAITAFALSAPLFNPLSLLYGLTLSRPNVIIGFAAASLFVVTALGMFWDRRVGVQPMPDDNSPQPIGWRRLVACAAFCGRELCGPTGMLILIGIIGVASLGMLLPHGALQTSAEQTDPLAPARMALVAIPVYATPMLTMSQLGMMFAHGNSPGAAFCLLLLGTGINLATIFWVVQQYQWRPAFTWLVALVLIVLGCAYLVDRPLIPPGIEPAGHTHAFDIYTNPFVSSTPMTMDTFRAAVKKTVTLAEVLGLAALAVILLSGLVSRGLLAGPIDRLIARGAAETAQPGSFDRLVPPWVVGAVCLAGLIAFSIVACYAYYPEPSETLEEIKIARVEALAGVTSRQYETALYWIPIWDDWSRKLEVGYALRNFELRPYQKAQAQLLRKKLELLEHEIEHAMELEKTARTIVPPLDHHHPEPNSESADGGHGHHGHDDHDHGDHDHGDHDHGDHDHGDHDHGDHDHGDHDHAHDDHEHHHPEEVYLELRALTRSLSETSRRLSEAFLTP